MELYYQTSDSLTLTIYVNGALQNADALPTITITRLSDNSAIVTGATSTLVSTGKYKFTLTPTQLSTLGQFRAVWSYSVSGVPGTKTDYYDVVVGYTNATQVRDYFPTLADKTNDEIYAKEKLARKIINVYCNQSFGFEDSVTKIFRGNNSNKLYFRNNRLWNLEQVLMDGTDDITSELEIYDDYWVAPIYNVVPGFDEDVKKGLENNSKYFRSPIKYHVKGDWGWESVPDNIQLAAIMLINDYFCDTALLREHGVLSYQIGEKDITFRRDLWGTTGNYNVDQLLADYVYVDVVLF